jgi:hypothetical protein
MKEETIAGLRALIANGTILGVVTLAEAEMFLKVVLLALTIAYTAFQFWKAARAK